VRRIAVRLQLPQEPDDGRDRIRKGEDHREDLLAAQSCKNKVRPRTHEMRTPTEGPFAIILEDISTTLQEVDAIAYLNNRLAVPAPAEVSAGYAQHHTVPQGDIFMHAFVPAAG
jgi:hypothetical protein